MPVVENERITWIETAPYVGQVRVRSLWPPVLSLCKLTLILLPREYTSPIPLPPDFKEEDWYEDEGRPCLVLGEAVLHSDEKYRPAPRYSLQDIVRTTREFSTAARLAAQRTLPPAPTAEQVIVEEKKNLAEKVKEFHNYYAALAGKELL